MKYGRGAGVTGIVDFPSLGALIEVRVYGFDRTISDGIIDATGRGDNNWGESWSGRKNGQLALFGLVRPDGWIMPSTFEGLTGTILLTMTTGVTETLDVRVTGQNIKRNEKTENLWSFNITCQVTDSPTEANEGAASSQPEPTAETHDDKHTWDGLSKTVDPKSLQDGATQRILIYGTADNDAAEVSEIAAQIAAATTPITSLKLRPVSFARLSADVCVVGLQWGRTDTEEDVINPATQTTVDPNELQTGGTVAAINATPTIPTIAGQTVVERTTTSRELNDSNTLYTTAFGNRSTIADIENPGTWTNTDPSDLKSTGLQTSVYTNGGSVTAASIPSGLQTVSTKIETINADKKQVTYEYAKNTSKQDIEFPGTYLYLDPSGLESKEMVTAVDVSDPALNTNLSVRGLKAQYLTPDHLVYVKEAGVRTTEQDITYLKSIINRATSLGTKDHRFVVEITTSATTGAPSNPDATNLSFRGTETYRITDTKYVHAHEFAPFTVEEEIEADGTESTVENPSVVSGGQPLIKEDKETVYDTNAAAPEAPTHSGLVCVRVSTRKLSKTGYSHTYYYDYRSNAAKLAADKSRITIDTSTIATESEATTAVVVATGASLGSPTLSGFVLQSYTDLATSNPAYDLRVYTWGLTTIQEAKENKGTTWGATAASVLEDTVTTINSSTLGGSAYRDSLYDTYQQDSTFKQLAVQKLLSGKYQVEVTTTGADKVILSGSSRVFEDSVSAVPYDKFSTGSDPTSPTARVLVGKLSAVVVGGPGGATAGRIDPIRFWRRKGSFSLLRRYSLAYASIDAKFFHSTETKVNNAAFLGHPAYSVMFEGATLEYALPNPTTDKMVAVFSYNFQTDSDYFFSDRNIPVGWQDCRTGVTLGSVGYFDPRSFVDYTAANDYQIQWPTTADFATTFL